MCRLRNIAMSDYQESVTTGRTDGQTDAGQSDPYVSLCFAGDTKTTYKQTKDKNLISKQYTLFDLSSFSHSDCGSPSVKTYANK